jgi:hypothetical protein
MAAFTPVEKQASIAQISNSGSSHVSESSPPPNHGSFQDHPFSDPATAQHWRQIYENAEYEGRHRFDPEYTWDVEEEKRLVKRVSKRN